MFSFCIKCQCKLLVPPLSNEIVFLFMFMCIPMGFDFLTPRVSCSFTDFWSPRCKEAFKKAKTHSHLQIYWFIMTQAFLLFLRAMQASMASEQSYFTASLMVMSDLSHMPPGPWTRLRKTTVRSRRKVLPLFLGSPNFTCISSDARSLCDHKPLLKIFAPDSATPVLAAARLQRWSLLLSSYHYEIEFKSSAEVASADASSRLPLQYRKDANVEEEIFHVASRQLKRHPVSAAEIAKDTSRNPLLAKTVLLTQNGWPINHCADPDLKPYFTRRHELSVEQGFLMWGLRTVIPPSLRQTILTELHEGHPGIARMKSIARGHVWWRKIDQEIEKAIRKCQPRKKKKNRAGLLQPHRFFHGLGRQLQGNGFT